MTFDLSDPGVLFTQDFLDDPAPLYAQLRADAPVWELPGTATYLVTSAALVAEAVGRADDFSSNLLGLLYTDDDGRPTVFDMTHLGSAIHVLATADPPTHTQHRKLMQPLFSPGALDAITPFVRDAAVRLVAALVDDPTHDLATAVAEPLPVEVICRLIGIPDDEVATLAPLVLQSNDLLAGVVDGAAMAAGAQASMQVVALLDALVRGWPADDTGAAICAALARAAARDEVSIEDGLGMLVQLLGAGTDTTTSLISRTALQLAHDPALQQRVRADLDLVPALLEEVLRIDGPFRFHYRSVPSDTELGGVPIPAGARLMLVWGSANLDDDAFDHAATFDIERAALRSHFAFGRGIHFCIGAPLARLEARAAIEALLRATSSFTLDPAVPPSYRRSIFVRRLAHLPLVLDVA